MHKKGNGSIINLISFIKKEDAVKVSSFYWPFSVK